MSDQLTLADLKPGQVFTISGFKDSTGTLSQRLMQLGIIEGGEIEMLRSAPGGDPVEYRVMGYSLSLRRAEAKEVLVAPKP